MEKRRHPRTELSMAVNIGLEGVKAPGRVIDVSPTGAKLTTRKELEVGQEIKMELFLSDNDPFPIRLVGVCRWARCTERRETVAGFDLSSSHQRNLGVLQRFLKAAAN